MVGALTVACALVACGSRSPAAPSNPLTTELSYLPANSPLVMMLATDPSSGAVKNANALLGKFEVAGFLESALKQKLQQEGINYDTDIRPLLGNPVVLGTSQPTLSGSNPPFIAAWVTKDAGALTALVNKKDAGARKVGTHDGATIYSFRTGALAIDGATAVIADTPAKVDAALDRHADNTGMTQSVYSQEVAGLPKTPLFEVFGDLKETLSTPQAASARRVPWVAALDGYAVAFSAGSSGLELDYRLDTTGQALTAAQLPIAAGSTPPGLITSGAGSLGLRDPAQLISFVESAEQAANPTGLASFLKGVAAIRAKTGVDVNSLLSQLSGDLVSTSQGHTDLVRAAVSSPTAVSQMFAKLQSHLRSLSPKLSATSIGAGFYALKEGSKTYNVGVVGNQIVAGNATPAALRQFAAEPVAPAAGAHGALAFRVSLQQALHLTGNLVHAPEATLILSQLGDVTGWLSASPGALTGSATLSIK